MCIIEECMSSAAQQSTSGRRKSIPKRVMKVVVRRVIAATAEPGLVADAGARGDAQAIPVARPLRNIARGSI